MRTAALLKPATLLFDLHAEGSSCFLMLMIIFLLGLCKK